MAGRGIKGEKKRGWKTQWADVEREDELENRF